MATNTLEQLKAAKNELIMEREYGELGEELIRDYGRELEYIIEHNGERWKRFKEIDEELYKKRQSGKCTALFFSFSAQKLKAVLDLVRKELRDNNEKNNT